MATTYKMLVIKGLLRQVETVQSRMLSLGICEKCVPQEIQDELRNMRPAARLAKIKELKEEHPVHITMPDEASYRPGYPVTIYGLCTQHAAEVSLAVVRASDPALAQAMGYDVEAINAAANNSNNVAA